jgi:hypothetical protein
MSQSRAFFSPISALFFLLLCRPDDIPEPNGAELGQFGFQSVDFGLQCEDVSLVRHQELGDDCILVFYNSPRSSV